MKENLEIAFRRKEKFLALEEGLLRKAITLFAMGFTPRNLSASQMSGIGERLKTFSSIQQAKSSVLKFLDRQLEKLEARKERSGKYSSWLIMSKDKGVELPLGKILTHWIEDEKYLEDISIIDEIVRLAALQRFWNNVYGLYCYQKVFGKAMPIEEEPS